MPQADGDADETASAVRAAIRQLLDAQGRSIERVSNDDSLTGALGLTSLDLIEIIAALNSRLRLDPFRQYGFTELQTVGDLVRAYADPQAGRNPDGELRISRRRAEARRARGEG